MFLTFLFCFKTNITKNAPTPKTKIIVTIITVITKVSLLFLTTLDGTSFVVLSCKTSVLSSFVSELEPLCVSSEVSLFEVFVLVFTARPSPKSFHSDFY